MTSPSTWWRRPRVSSGRGDRKSTRLNSSHVEISYAVFRLKKKKNEMGLKHPSKQSKNLQTQSLITNSQFCMICPPFDCGCILVFFFFHDTATTEIYTLSLHDALPISTPPPPPAAPSAWTRRSALKRRRDRKSTRLNSSHVEISYAVFCLKKKKII